MGYISTYASHTILNFLLGKKAVTLPTSYSLALSTTTLGADAAGLTEPTDASYKRLVIPNNKTQFTNANKKGITNINEMIFPQSVNSWGTVTHFALFDNNNNLWSYGKLAVDINTEADSSVILDPNLLSIKLDIKGGSKNTMFLTTVAANKILDYFFGGVALTPPTTYHIGLSTTAMDIEGVGYTEPTATKYKRLAVPNDKVSFTDAANKTVTFKKEFRYETAEVTWGNLQHYLISDAATGGTVWWGGSLTRSRDTHINTTLVIKPNGFVWKLDN